MEVSVKDIALLLDGVVEGDGNRKIRSVGKIENALEGDIAFLANTKYESFAYSTQATALIVSKDFKPKSAISPALIRVEDPYSAFTALLEQYQRMQNLSKVGIEQPSFIGDDVKTGEEIYRGAFSYIGKGCRLGDHVKIYPNVYVGENVHIGDYSIIQAGAKIYPNTLIGKRCVVQAGAVIGSDGFGFAPQADGSYKAIPQLGNVILEDDVSIGANTTIDCATMGSTIIKKGTKLDNLIQIAHNVEVGEHTVIAAQTGISGSAKIGSHSMIGGQVGIAGHLQLARGTKITAQAGISKTITDENIVLMGSPAFNHKDYLRSYAIFRNLPELFEKIKKLEKGEM
jgi:UDP-3-O-[3-hydroxymyristoyl] glucosamine N-acyltransferase